MTRLATTGPIDVATLARCDELHHKMRRSEIELYATRFCTDNGINVTSTIEAAGTFPPIGFEKLVEETAELDHQPAYGYRAVMASAVSGLTLPASVINHAVGMAVQSGFESDDSVSKWTTLGRPESFKKEFRPIVEEVAPPSRHERGGATEHTSIDVLHSEGVQIARFSRQVTVDEMDEHDVAPIIPAMAAALGRSARTLIEDLGYGVLIAGRMDDGQPICDAAFSNQESGKPLTAGNLGEAYAAMRQQLSNEERKLNANVMPTALVVGSGNFLNALQIAETFNQQPFIVVESPRIDTGIWNQDTETAVAGTPGSWWLIDPRRSVERAFLDGEEKLRISRHVSNGRDGRWATTWSINLSMAIKALDRRCVFRRDA